MTMLLILGLVWVHFVADFILQSDMMATNKSTSLKWLGYHVLVYTGCMAVFLDWRFFLLNGLIHFCVDYVTSRGTSYLWTKNERHWFFCLIGFDQAIHLSTLVLTARWFL
jgi:membrane-bound metal-dependent hydrolase YbcI (DUF457 family)